CVLALIPSSRPSTLVPTVWISVIRCLGPIQSSTCLCWNRTTPMTSKVVPFRPRRLLRLRVMTSMRSRLFSIRESAIASSNTWSSGWVTTNPSGIHTHISPTATNYLKSSTTATLVNPAPLSLSVLAP
ncbi:hypothetical protein BGX33_004314, partial [Mortierella sp. NVP41]